MRANLNHNQDGVGVTRVSEELEKLVLRIQQQLAPKAEVLHNVRIKGRHSGTLRQIDVLVTERIGQYTINIIIDCKDYKRPIDVKGVEEFNGLLDDVGAQKGVLVCPCGFTEAAKKRASKYQIDLYSPVDTSSHKWQASVKIPALCDWRGVSIAFGVSVTSPLPFLLPYDFFTTAVAKDEAGNILGNPVKHLVTRWNEGDIIDELGETGDVPIFKDVQPFVDNGYGQQIPVNLYANMRIYRQLRYGQLPISKISGFKDELSGKVITNAFEIGLLDPEEIDRDWQLVKDESEVHPKAIVVLRGVICWDAESAMDSVIFGPKLS